MAAVDILLATYNGEQFISAQLHSLQMQTFTDFRILVHDDGSSDKTVEIVRQFARNDSRIVIIDDNVKCGAAPKNFMHLLQFATAPWIMFCDQDDVWFDNKIKDMMQVADNCDCSKPVAIYSQSLFWYPQIGICGKGGGYKAPRKLNELLLQNSGIQGSVSLFNQPTREIMLRFSGELVMHDYLLALTAMTFGEVRHINVPLMLYRQHDNNVTHNPDMLISPLKRIKRKLLNPLPVMDPKHMNTTASFLNCFHDEMPVEHIELLEEIIRMPYQNKLKNLWVANKHKMTRFRSRPKLLLKILIADFIAPERRQELKQ